jgi:hypothetical protein
VTHAVHTAQAKGWETLSNGALLNALEAAGLKLLLTTDRRIRHQQNLQGRRVALVVLTGTTRSSVVCATPVGRELLESLQHPTALAADGCPV